MQNKLPVTVLINFNPERTKEGEFNYKKQKRVAEKETGFVQCDVTDENCIQFKQLHEIDECDHSNIEVKVMPSQEGQDLYLHVFLGSVEVIDSPLKISIEKSEKHK